MKAGSGTSWLVGISASWTALKKNERPHPCLRGDHPIDHHVAGTFVRSVDRAPR